MTIAIAGKGMGAPAISEMKTDFGTRFTGRGLHALDPRAGVLRFNRHRESVRPTFATDNVART